MCAHKLYRSSGLLDEDLKFFRRIVYPAIKVVACKGGAKCIQQNPSFQSNLW